MYLHIITKLSNVSWIAGLEVSADSRFLFWNKLWFERMINVVRTLINHKRARSVAIEFDYGLNLSLGLYHMLQNRGALEIRYVQVGLPQPLLFTYKCPL